MFVRTRNGMEPTPYAASMIPVIENALSKLEAATRGKAISTRPKIRTLSILARWITSSLCTCPPYGEI
jgi:DNA-binding transcriptional LysR family regulator